MAAGLGKEMFIPYGKGCIREGKIVDSSQKNSSFHKSAIVSNEFSPNKLVHTI